MTTNEPGHVLRIGRILGVPRGKAFACWTTAERLRQWWVPAPWTSPEAELDFRPGGSNRVVMRSPDGQTFVHQSVFLDIVENERIVFTDAFTRAWVPSAKAFITGEVTFADASGGTRYDVAVWHWSEADSQQHEDMGFQAAWSTVIDQMEALAKTL